MELIENPKTRLVTYNKRTANLQKKVKELSILCGIDACIVILGPQLNRHHRIRPTTWPSDSYEVRRIIERFLNSNQPRKCSYVSDYFADKKKKVVSEIAELRKQNFKAKYYPWHQFFDSFSEHRLRAFDIQLKGKIELAVKRIQMFKQNQQQNVELTTQERSQLGHDRSNGFFTNLMVYGGQRSSEPQIPTYRFYPENAQLNPNLVDMNIDRNNDFATILPLNVEPLQSSYRGPAIDDTMMNGLNNNHRSGNLMNDPDIPQTRSSYVSQLSWMRNNDLMLYNPNSFLQPMVPQFQSPLLPNTPYQVHPPPTYELNGNMGLLEKDHEWKWK